MGNAKKISEARLVSFDEAFKPELERSIMD